MNKALLKLNRILFWWYYKRCGDHFKQWTFFKSVKLLIENYEHLNLMYENEKESSSSFALESSKHRQALFELKMKMIATDEQIGWANKTLGIGGSKSIDN